MPADIPLAAGGAPDGCRGDIELSGICANRACRQCDRPDREADPAERAVGAGCIHRTYQRICLLDPNRLSKYTTPSRVAIIYATEPVFAALTGILFAGERLTLIGGIGCLCILAGMMIAELKSAPQKVQ